MTSGEGSDGGIAALELTDSRSIRCRWSGVGIGMRSLRDVLQQEDPDRDRYTDRVRDSYRVSQPDCDSYQYANAASGQRMLAFELARRAPAGHQRHRVCPAWKLGQ